MSQILNPKLERSKKTGFWEIRWSERRQDRYVSRALSTRTPNRVEAETVFSGFLDAEAQATKAASSPILRDFLNDYSSVLKAKGDCLTQLICVSHLDRCLGDLRLAEITPERLLAYRRNRGVADGTLRRELETLNAAINLAVRHKKLKVDDKPIVDLPRKSQPRRVYLKDDEERHFYELAMSHSQGQARLTRLTRFVALALDTAARKDAIEGLSWDRVDLTAGTIDYREPGLQIHNKRRAVVPVSKRLRPLLEQMHREKTTEFVLDHAGEIRTTWENWIKHTPYSHITPHDLRRTWATLAAQAGVPIVNIAAILGDSVEITLRHYAQFAPGNAQAAVDARHK